MMASRIPVSLLVSFLVFFAADAHCQDKREFIITSSNDTIYGNVKYNKSNPELVDFKKEGDESFINYSPEEVRLFYLKTFDLYEAVSIANSDKKTFLLRLENGKISLYRLAMGYLLVKDSRAYKMNKKDTVINNNAREDKKYTGLLNVLTEDCQRTKNKGASVRFNDEELTKFIRRYNNCESRPADRVGEDFSRRDPPMVGLKGGVNFTHFYFPASIKTYNKYKLTSSDSYSFGIFGSMPLSRKLSAVLEYSKVTTSGDVLGRDSKYGNLPAKEDAHFDLEYNQMNFSLRYSPIMAKFKPFVTAGFFFGRSPKLTGYRRIHIGGALDQTVREDFMFISSYDVGYSVGVGANTEVKNLFILGLNYNFEQTAANKPGDEHFEIHAHFLTFSAAVNIHRLVPRGKQ